MSVINQFVSDYMTTNVITINKYANLIDAIRELDLKCMAAILVVNDQGQLCGILSNSDLIGLTYDLHCDVAVLPRVSDAIRQTLTDALAKENESLRVTDAMTADIFSTTPHASLRDAARTMMEYGVHHLPVVDESNRPIGIISTYDIVRSVSNGD